MPADIRSIIKMMGASIAAAVGIVLPTLYAAEELRQARYYVDLGAANTAENILKHARSETDVSSLSFVRLKGILDQRPEEDKESRQSVISSAGAVLFTEDKALQAPILTRRAPIEVDGQTIGWVQAEETLQPILHKAGLVALVCGILGFAAYFGFRVLPLRALNRTLTSLEARNKELQDRQAELRAQYLISDAALSNMSQGLCMFDHERRLVISNKRFTELYDMPGELTKPGTAYVDIMKHLIARGHFEGDRDEFLQGRLKVAASAEPRIDIFEYAAGRVVEINRQPLPGGGWLATYEDISERRRSETRISYLATHDALTDLPNRVLFRERLEEALERTERGERFAVHCLDLDRFKDVNDMQGHAIGDTLLQQAAERLRDSVRGENVVGRLGGDEFAVIQCQVEAPEAAGKLAMRIIQALSAPYHVHGQELSISASVGIALVPGDGTDPDQLMKNADLALYRAKSDGRGTFRFFEREMDARLQARRRFEGELRTALTRKEFEVYYQPVLDVQANAITGFEALLRWHHPLRGMVPPAEFIPVAEETGLIIAIGEWVLRQACAEAAGWPTEIKVAVNLSAVQFKSQNLVATVTRALADARLAPDRLELEVTESVLLLESQATLATLHKLREQGVRIAMDDFGTGYSSLSYLRSFPFDKIKIDRSFVRDLATKHDASAIVHAIADLARNLGMTTTAEGVETDEHFAMLRSEGCTEIQGYLISPPKPADHVRPLLARFNAQGLPARARSATRAGSLQASG
jgi:diguanylate cyclase (GGDEF)-like protein